MGYKFFLFFFFLLEGQIGLELSMNWFIAGVSGSIPTPESINIKYVFDMDTPPSTKYLRFLAYLQFKTFILCFIKLLL